jgi:hypothetical protein
MVPNKYFYTIFFFHFSPFQLTLVFIFIELLQALSPQPEDASFQVWWKRTNECDGGAAGRGLNSLIILGAWTLWKQQNRCVFEGTTPSLVAALTQAGEERCMWELAGARGLSSLTAAQPVS